MVDRSLAAQAESLAGVEALDIKDLNIGLGHAEKLRREGVKKKNSLRLSVGKKKLGVSDSELNSPIAR